MKDVKKRATGEDLLSNHEDIDDGVLNSTAKKSTPPNRRYFLTFATNFKNENPYLAEWLEYHILMGVEHFYLYDQDGGEEAREILRPYEDAGFVTRHPWTQYNGTRYDRRHHFYEPNKNHLGFAHCARSYRDQFTWVMKIDVDEFLYPLGGGDSVLPYLRTIDCGRFKGVNIPRIDFGDNGHLIRPEGLVTASYTRREESPSNHKDLANGAFLTTNRFCFSAHWWRYKPFRYGHMLPRNEVDGIRINHYYLKSTEEYRRRQNTNRGRNATESGFINHSKRCNAIRDEGMLRFSQRIAEAMAARGL